MSATVPPSAWSTLRPRRAPAAAGVFPLRVACVDLGSNAIRFLAQEHAADGSTTCLASERRAVRLGHGVFVSGRLDPAAVDAAVAELAAFRVDMDRLGVTHWRAVATSAVREASNGPAFVERVRRETGLELEVVNGAEEARLVHLAVSRRLALGPRPWLLADLGGGSVEVALVDQDGAQWSESHTMGSVRLLEELTQSGSDPGRFRRLLEEYVAALRAPAALHQRQVAGYIATGGNIETLVKLAGTIGDGGIGRLPLAALQSLIDQLAAMSYRQRVDQLGLRPDRADVILPAAMVYHRLGVVAGVREIIVPQVGLKDGLLHDLVDRLQPTPERAEVDRPGLVAAATSLGRRYLVDEAHARHVAALALSLFDQTATLHGLGRDDRPLLHAAALLHEVGRFVAVASHHKHARYLIAASELPGCSRRDMELVATVVRYHRKGEPSSRHRAFAALPGRDRRRARRLAAILRLADALDPEHRQRVAAVRAQVADDAVTLWLDGSGDLVREGRSVTRRAQLFTRLFDSELRLKQTLAVLSATA